MANFNSSFFKELENIIGSGSSSDKWGRDSFSINKFLDAEELKQYRAEMAGFVKELEKAGVAGAEKEAKIRRKSLELVKKSSRETLEQLKTAIKLGGKAADDIEDVIKSQAKFFSEQREELERQVEDRKQELKERRELLTAETAAARKVSTRDRRLQVELSELSIKNFMDEFTETSIRAGKDFSEAFDELNTQLAEAQDNVQATKEKFGEDSAEAKVAEADLKLITRRVE